MVRPRVVVALRRHFAASPYQSFDFVLAGPFAEGDGIKVAEQINASLIHMDQVQVRVACIHLIQRMAGN
jgi:hypothetical protein